MNCYNHPQVPALGICTSCNKGICLDCSDQERNDFICKICSSTPARKESPKPAKAQPGQQGYGLPIFMCLFGLINISSFLIYRNFDYMSFSIGLLFIGYGIYRFIQIYNHNQQRENDDLLDR